MIAPPRVSVARRVLGALLLAVSLVSVVPSVLMLGGAFLPGVPYIGPFGRLILTNLGFGWLTLLIAASTAGGAYLVRRNMASVAIIPIAAVAVLAMTVVTVRLLQFADEHHATFSLDRQLVPVELVRVPDDHIVFASVDGVDLAADVWRPPAGAPDGGRVGVLFIHGGAFSAGGLGTRTYSMQFLASRGYSVLEVEYRLAPPPRWADAPADALCALGWFQAHANELGVDPDRIVIWGDSAGGSLGLLAAYTAGTGALQPSCDVDPQPPLGVLGMAPAADLAGIWDDDSLFVEGRRFPEVYVGGSPSEFPDRYDVASPFRYIIAAVPPTLLIGGENDSLVRPARVDSIYDALVAAGAEAQRITVPYADHGFDGDPDGFGMQVLETIIPDFLEALAAR